MVVPQVRYMDGQRRVAVARFDGTTIKCAAQFLAEHKMQGTMEFAIGIVLGAVIALSTTAIGFARDRSFYPTVLIVIASYYGLFAVMGGSVRTVATEVVPMAAFFGLAVAGFKRSGWLVAIGLFGHAIFDFFHGHFIDNPGVPIWWPGFCLSIDFTLGAFLSFYLFRSRKHGNAL